MNKKTRSIFVLFTLAAGTLVTLATSPASPVKAAEPVESSALYKLAAVESEATPIGCTGCSPQKTNVPTFTVQDTIGNTVAAATEIDTFNTSAWDQVAQTSVTIQGGCAIVAGGLRLGALASAHLAAGEIALEVSAGATLLIAEGR